MGIPTPLDQFHKDLDSTRWVDEVDGDIHIELFHRPSGITVTIEAPTDWQAERMMGRSVAAIRYALGLDPT